MKKVIIVGAGGHGKVVADIIKLNGDVVIGYLDDKNPNELPGYNIIGNTSLIGQDDCWYFVAIGNGSIRKKFMNEFNAKWYTAVHPTAVISESVLIGAGSCVMANAIVNADSVIGQGVIINTAATVDHDCNIGDFVHIAPGVHISGTVTIGEETWVGVGSIVSNNVDICAGCLIGAGAVVIKNIMRKGTYIGTPAKRIK